MIWVQLTRPMVDALERTPFAIEHPEAIHAARHGLMTNQIRIAAGAGPLLVDSLKKVSDDPDLHHNTRRAVGDCISLVEAQMGNAQRMDEALDNPEYATEMGKHVLASMRRRAERDFSEDMEVIEKWAEFDPDVREPASRLRDALARLQDAIEDVQRRA